MYMYFLVTFSHGIGSYRIELIGQPKSLHMCQNLNLSFHLLEKENIKLHHKKYGCLGNKRMHEFGAFVWNTYIEIYPLFSLFSHQMEHSLPMEGQIVQCLPDLLPQSLGFHVVNQLPPQVLMHCLLLFADFPATLWEHQSHLFCPQRFVSWSFQLK